jgi:N utilization substance protein B
MARTASPHRPRHLARQRAVQALYRWQLNPDTPRAIAEDFIARQDFKRVDVDHFRDLVIRAGQEAEAIAGAYAAHLDRPWERLDPMERAILMLAWVELHEHPEVPVRVVIDEAIELAHRFGATESHTFVNGVLDRYAREVRTLEAAELR